MTSFQDFGLADPISRALKEENYLTPTPIQAQTIPLAITGRDVVGIAQTGTGKTAAFALPILHHLAGLGRARPKTCQALVLAPTRELAAQIADSFRTYGRNLRLSVAVVVGGVGYGPQIQALSRGVDVLVATPGRLLDHLQTGAVRLDATRIVVLDEADHMLDLGFIVPIRRIIKEIQKRDKVAIKPEEVFFVDDWQENVVPVRNMGATGILYGQDVESYAELMSMLK